jgi:enolase
MSTISSLKAIEILDSRGKPTVRVFLTLKDGRQFRSSVPSGASTGAHEAVELRDGDAKRHLGQGVLTAVKNVNEVIAPALKDISVLEQKLIDDKMIELDGTENKGRLGANAILAVSMAVAKAAASVSGKKRWEYLHDAFFADRTVSFPRLMVNVVNGGKHAGWNFDIQEFMVVPKSNIPSQSTRIAAEIFQQLGKNLKKKKLSTLVGDEGGYSPALSSNEEVLAEVVQAAQDIGYQNGKEYGFALDSAATEFYSEGTYLMKKTGETLNSDQLTAFYARISQAYGIESFEDPFAEDDWAAFKKFTELATQHHFQVVGDDLLVTNPKRIRRGIDEKASNAVLVKVNQIGSLSETVEAVRMAQDAGWKIAISHRSGETEDNFIADLAYACGAEFIKTGSMSRSDRLSKYNRLLEIEAGF